MESSICQIIKFAVPSHTRIAPRDTERFKNTRIIEAVELEVILVVFGRI